VEGPPGVVEAVRVGEADVAAGGHALCVAALHPHDGPLMDSGTPAAVAIVRPPMRQETPENAED
jgi:hypothetical protein